MTGRYFPERKRAFTLVEVLLVSSIFAMLALAAFTCLVNGLRLWTATQELVGQEDVVILLDRMTAEFKNAFLFSNISFAGEDNRISFPTVVTTAADKNSSRAREESIEEIGSVRYIFDPASGEILRAQANYSQAVRGDAGSATVEVRGVKEMRFRYYYADSSSFSMSTSGKDALPCGVEIEIHLPQKGEEDAVFRRYMAIPVGV